MTASWFGRMSALRRLGVPGSLPLLLGILGNLPGAGSLSAQSLLDRPARLSVEDVILEDAIRALQRSSGVSMAFSPDLLPENHRVSCSCDTVLVGAALDSLLAGTGLYYMEGRRQVLIGLREEGEQRPRAPPTVSGRVLEAGSGFPVSGAQVAFHPASDEEPPEGGRGTHSNGMVRAVTGGDGRFAVQDVPPGEYRIRVQAPGFLEPEPWAVTTERALQPLQFEIFRLPIPLEAIVISPGSFGLLEGAPGAMGTRVSRDEIESIPQFGDDAFRALQRMPGVASGDITTQLNVRGSAGRDLLVLLDGLELFEPFHLKELDGVFGIVDIQSLGEIDLVTGGFGVEQGGRVGGVFDMRTRSPPEVGTRTTLGASLSSMSATSQGTFAEGRGEWLTAARWGFLDIVLNITGDGEEVSPTYWDILGKTSYRLSDDHFVSLHLLMAGDNVEWVDDVSETGSDLQSSWNNRYFWGNWNASILPGLRANTTVAMGGVSRDRGGQTWHPGGGVYSPMRAFVRDEADFSFHRIRQEWQVDLGEDLLIKAGADLQGGDGRYDYDRKATFLYWDNTGQPVPIPDSAVVDLGVHGREVGLWGAVRGQSRGGLTWEAGLRFDHQTHIDDSDLAPRVLLRWDPAPGLILRGSWGRYAQSQGIHELSAQDGEMEFSPSELAEQLAIGMEGRLPGGILGRVEAYRRSVSSPRPQFLNLSREVNPFLEVQWDRIRIHPTEGRAKGLEFLLAGTGVAPFSWSASYALAETEQKVMRRWVPRILDQRHTLNLHVAYQLGRKWRFSGAYQYHTGWPVTKQYVYEEAMTSGGVVVGTAVRREFGPLNGERLPDYRRLDLRVSRMVELRQSRLEIYLDLFNVTDEANLRAYQYSPPSWNPSAATPGRTAGEELLPFLPTLGFRWVF